jgi:hypothetical protein
MAWIEAADRYACFAERRESRGGALPDEPDQVSPKAQAGTLAPTHSPQPLVVAGAVAPSGRPSGMKWPASEQVAVDELSAQGWAAGLVARLERLIARVEGLADSMSMRFLYDPKRRLFTVGYNVAGSVFFGSDNGANDYNGRGVRGLIDSDEKILRGVGLSDAEIEKYFSENLRRYVGAAK